MARKLFTDSHVFSDGLTFRNVRDAIVAASTAGMWHVSHDMARQYRVDNMLCFKCGKVEMSTEGFTYFTYRDRAIRVCVNCRPR